MRPRYYYYHITYSYTSSLGQTGEGSGVYGIHKPIVTEKILKEAREHIMETQNFKKLAITGYTFVRASRG